MKIQCFTSFTFSYLDRARVLFESLRRHHPGWTLVALITDRPPPGLGWDPSAEPFDRLVYGDALGIRDYPSWLFRHEIVEACTAVKGPYLAEQCEGDADILVYLDPDIAVFGSLDPLIEALDTHEILLTPHLLAPETAPGAVFDNEITALRHGIYNLGFLAIRTRGEGARFARWWRDRLIEHCYDDVGRGLFVDQRWCDHVPAFFEKVGIVRDPGCNVASWNLSRRRVAIGRDGAITVNGAPLRFWHFTKLGPVGETMTRRYAQDNFEVYEIWNWYKRRVRAAADPAIAPGYWAHGVFADGSTIRKPHRILYRARPDLQVAFPDPFRAGPGSYRGWLSDEGLLEAAA